MLEDSRMSNVIQFSKRLENEIYTLAESPVSCILSEYIR